MILRDGLLGHNDYPADQPVLQPPPRAKPVQEPPGVLADADYWILHVRPMLIAAGNLKETEEHKKQHAEVSRRLRKSGAVPPVPSPAPEPVADPVDDNFPGVPF